MKNKKTNLKTKFMAILLIIAIMSFMAIPIFASEVVVYDDSYSKITNDNITIFRFNDSSNLIRQRFDTRELNEDDETIGAIYDFNEKNAVFDNATHTRAQGADLVVTLPSATYEGFITENCFPIDNEIKSNEKQWYIYFDYSFGSVDDYKEFVCNSCIIRFYDENYNYFNLIRLTEQLTDNSLDVIGNFVEFDIPENAEYFSIYIEYENNESFSDCTFYGNLNNFFITDTVFDISLYDELVKEKSGLKPNEVITPVVQSSTSLLAGIGKGAVNFFESVFVADDGGISTLGIYCLAFVGIGMAIGIMRWIRKKSG